MAFYAYKGDADYCYSTPYNSYGFDSNPIQSYLPYNPPQSIDYNSTPLEMNNYSVYTHSEPNIIEYNPIEYSQASFNYNQCYVNPSELVQYQPPSYNQDQFYSTTKFRVSYSVSSVPEVDETDFIDDFDEYDPTPYDGGYDQAMTYGRPLPPSDKICFPRSTSLSNPIAVPDKQKDEIEIPVKPPIELKPADPIDTKLEPENGVAAEPVDVLPTDEAVSHEPGKGNEAADCYGYGMSERQTGRIPYGSGLESMDLCESLFGYWPCVAKRERDERLRQREDCEGERRYDDPWNTAADYLFGSPVVCGYENYPQLRTLYPE